MSEPTPPAANSLVKLKDIFQGDISQFESWVKENTAVLVIHGVGNQKPLETLDTFGRGLIDAYVEYGGLNADDLKLSHRLSKKTGDSSQVWFDNIIRISHKESDKSIDLYEYFWAHYPEGKVSLSDMQRFVETTAKGAQAFYSEQEKLGQVYGDRSFFFENGRFQAGRYRMVIRVSSYFIPTMVKLYRTFLNLLRGIPWIGRLAYALGEKLEKSAINILTSVAGDVAAYNTLDPKYHLYTVRKKILGGAVAALRYLLEPGNDGPYQKSDWPYGKVLLAGHSLGGQVAFDAINRFDHLLAQGEIRGTDSNGFLILNGKPSRQKISDRFAGLVTFGCPLDKVAFFFRERCGKERYLQQQILENFHCFKQRDWSLAQDDPPFTVQSTLARLLEDMPWRNYFDPNDPISGGLDFYHELTNINCHFEEGNKQKLPGFLRYIWPFTHSRYWKCREMYGDIINQLLHR